MVTEMQTIDRRLAKAIRLFQAARQLDAEVPAHAMAGLLRIYAAAHVNGTPLSQGEVVAGLAPTPPTTVDRALGKLKSWGLVEARRDTSDGRVLRHYCTPKGLMFISELLGVLGSPAENGCA